MSNLGNQRSSFRNSLPTIPGRGHGYSRPARNAMSDTSDASDASDATLLSTSVNPNSTAAASDEVSISSPESDTIEGSTHIMAFTPERPLSGLTIGSISTNSGQSRRTKEMYLAVPQDKVRRKPPKGRAALYGAGAPRQRMQDPFKNNEHFTKLAKAAQATKNNNQT